MHPDATVVHRVTVESPASHKKIVTKVRNKIDVMHIRGYTIGVVIDMPLQIEIHLLLYLHALAHYQYLLNLILLIYLYLCIISFVGRVRQINCCKRFTTSSISTYW